MTRIPTGLFSRLALAIAATALLSAASASPASATAYFLRADGDDAAVGTTRATAWRTLDRLNATDLEPGDLVLLEGRAVFPGTLVIAPEDAGTRRRPVKIRSFGGGRATIDAGTGRGIFVNDAGGVSPVEFVPQGVHHGAA